MKLIFNEIHFNNYVCIPTIEIELKDKTELPNIISLNDTTWEIEREEYYPYFINFSYGIFDSLTNNTLDLLNDIYLLTNDDYINSKFWIYFTAISELNLPPIKTTNKYYKSNNTNHQKIINYFNKNTSNIDIKTIFKNEYNFIKETFPFLNRTTYKISNYLLLPNDVDSYMLHNSVNGYQSKFLVSNEIEAKNELELLYSFMNVIFSSKFNYYIKKCQYCNKFYISTKSDSKYCNRINLEKNKTCKQLATIQRIKYGNLKEYQKVDKKIRAYFSRQSDDVNKKFINNYREFIKSNPNASAEEKIDFLEKYRNDYKSSLTKL